MSREEILCLKFPCPAIKYSFFPSRPTAWTLLERHTWGEALLLLKTWVYFLVGVELKDTTKAKVKRKKYFLLILAVRRTPGIFSKAVSFNSKIGDPFRLRIHAYS